jgi:hypothetical protein
VVVADLKIDGAKETVSLLEKAGGDCAKGVLSANKIERSLEILRNLARLRGFNSLDKLLDFFSSKISNGRRFYRGLNRL